MVIENTIADAIDFFRIDARSAAVPLKVQIDLQITLMASALYRILAKRLGSGMENAMARTVFDASAISVIPLYEFAVSLGKRAKNPSCSLRETSIKER